MPKKLFTRLLIILIVTSNGLIYADEPWFTDPLIALSGKTVPFGQSNLQLYGYYVTSNAIYDRNWLTITTPQYTSAQFVPEFSYGLADHVDIEYDLPYINNQMEGKSISNLGDILILLGFQLLEQKAKDSNPDLRLTIQETFPTGHYDRLTVGNLGADGTGSGSYQTSIGLNFERLLKVSETHYLNTHACLTYTYASTVSLKGFSVYGSSPLTQGDIAPGNSVSLDLAFELSVTQNWVAVMEGLFVYQEASSFHGFLGPQETIKPLSPVSQDKNGRQRILFNRLIPSRHNIGGTGVGSGNLDEFSLAPALEYNFSQNMGIIGGVWFTVAGKNTPSFATPVVALNATW